MRWEPASFSPESPQPSSALAQNLLDKCLWIGTGSWSRLYQSMLPAKSASPLWNKVQHGQAGLGSMRSDKQVCLPQNIWDPLTWEHNHDPPRVPSHHDRRAPCLEHFGVSCTMEHSGMVHVQKNTQHSIKLGDGIWVVTSFPGITSGKESACQCRKHKRHGFNPWVGKIPCMALTPLYLPEESPWLEEPDGLQSIGSQRVRHDWVLCVLLLICLCTLCCWKCLQWVSSYHLTGTQDKKRVTLKCNLLLYLKTNFIL